MNTFFAKFGLSQNKSSIRYIKIAKLGQGTHFRGQNRHWSILTGALVAGSYIMVILAQILHVVCRFIGNWARGINSWGQNKY